jgi:flagellar biosynthesis protein FlhB
VSVHDDRLHAEVDRQLTEARAACDGLATRSGLLIAAAAAVAAILAPNIHAGHHEVLLVLALITFGVATLAAIVTLMPWLAIGPLATSLASWASGKPSASTSSLLYDSKIVILMADLNRLLAMRIFFAIQAITTVTAVALALGYTAWK